MTTGLYRHPDCTRHDMGTGHPEQPARMAAVMDGLAEAGLTDYLAEREAPLVTREALLRAHPQAYLDVLARYSPKEGSFELDPDTTMNAWSLDAAGRAAGAGVAAVDAVMAGELENAFCAVRPPGHHAERRVAMGFCFYSNIAVAAKHALDHHGLERVAICDFDVHHGNGTEDVVEGDTRILFCSSFEYPLFPGKYGSYVPLHRINCPLAHGSGGDEFRDAITERWLPELESFQPQLMLISAGFDAHRADPIGGLALVEADFRWVTEQLRGVAERHAHGRLVSMLEGGYNLGALGRCAAVHVEALM